MFLLQIGSAKGDARHDAVLCKFVHRPMVWTEHETYSDSTKSRKLFVHLAIARNTLEKFVIILQTGTHQTTATNTSDRCQRVPYTSHRFARSMEIRHQRQGTDLLLSQENHDSAMGTTDSFAATDARAACA